MDKTPTYKNRLETLIIKKCVGVIEAESKPIKTLSIFRQSYQQSPTAQPQQSATHHAGRLNLVLLAAAFCLFFWQRSSFPFTRPWGRADYRIASGSMGEG